jgi:hypothetical protein
VILLFYGRFHGSCKPGVHSLSGEQPFADRSLTNLGKSRNSVTAATITYFGDSALTIFRDMKFDNFPYTVRQSAKK